MAEAPLAVELWAAVVDYGMVQSWMAGWQITTIQLQFILQQIFKETLLIQKNKNKTVFHIWLEQGFVQEKDENRADLCLRSIAFSFESGCL